MAEATIKELERKLKESEQRAAEAKSQLDEAKKASAQSESVLSRIRKEIGATETSEPVPSRLRMIFLNPTVYIVAIIAVAILWILWKMFQAGSGEGTLLEDLRDPAFARGLITFIFSIGALGIGIILTVAALAPGDDAGKAFTRGKEIFTILVGILGTIIGFYFGANAIVANEKPAKLTVAAIEASTNNPPSGTEVTLSSAISGGNAPYKTFWAFDHKDIDPETKVALSEGAIDIVIQTPPVDDDAEIKIELLVSDAKLNTSMQTTTLTVTKQE